MLYLHECYKFEYKIKIYDNYLQVYNNILYYNKLIHKITDFHLSLVLVYIEYFSCVFGHERANVV